jgi:hypothetical protein
MNFWSELDAEAKDLRGEAIQRFALGMDLPMERILGMSANRHRRRTSTGDDWGAWQIDEDTIKMHIELMLEVIAQAHRRLHPARPRRRSTATVRYDTSSLRPGRPVR